MKYNFHRNLDSRYLNLLPLAICVGFALMFTACKEKPKNGHDTTTTDNGGTAGKGYSDSSASSVIVFDQNGRVCIQQSNTSYEMVNIVESDSKTPLLLKIKKTELCFADSINKDKVYEISGKSVLDSKSVSWNIQFVATDISFKDNTIIAIKEGTDNENDFIKRFSLLNGNEVFSCSFADLEVKVPNVISKFFIGYTSKKAASGPLALLKDENLLGVVRLGSSDAAIDSFKIKLKRSKMADKLLASVPDLILASTGDNTTAIDDGRSLILKGDSRYLVKDVQGFGVKFTYYYGDDNETINIFVPVDKGKFDIAHATYDKDIFELSGF